MKHKNRNKIINKNTPKYKEDKAEQTTMSKPISACSDIFVKFLFGSKENNDILLSFINAVLAETKYEQAVTVEVLNPFNIQEYYTDKLSVVDVKATDAYGRIFDIEVQTGDRGDFVGRSLYYWAEVYSSQITEAQPYKKLKPVICINIMSFNILESKNFFNTFSLTERTTGEILTTDLSINYIELQKLIDLDSATPLKKFSYFLKTEGRMDQKLANYIETDPLIKKAHESYSRFTADDRLREIYRSRTKFLQDQISLMEEKYEKGLEKGLQKGLKIHEKKVLEIARNFKKSGTPIETIVLATGLSSKVIEEI